MLFRSEGVYAWVDLNDLRGNFREPGRSLEGVIEVGGASAQVTYASTNAPGDHSASVTVNNTTYRLFSISWLGLGQNEARAAMFKRIHEGGGETNNVCYPNNPAAAGNLTGFNVDIQGYRVNSAQFDLAQCESLYSAVLQPFNVRSASANSDFASVRFVGVSSVYYAFSDWGGLTDAASIRENLRAVCTGVNAWESVAARLGGTNKFKQNACANGTFINSLLFGSNGLGVEPTKVTAVDKVAGRTPSWTRGFALVGK